MDTSTASNLKYDARVISESFYDPLTGKIWPIEFSDWTDYKDRSKQNTSQIAVLGYENMGKSFLLSKIMDRQLPQGKHTKTKGLCVLYPKDKLHPWTAIDTPGTNISVKSEKAKRELKNYFESRGVSKEDIMRMLFGDNILMEALLQEFVILHAQVILVVVSKLRRDDQRLITRIKSLPGKRVLIVHNLFDSHDLQNVQDIINEDIKEAFKVTEKMIQVGKNKNVNSIVFLETDSKSIEHIVIAKEDSVAGRYYNEVAFNYMRKVIDGCNYSQPFDLVQAFTKYLNTYFRRYLSALTNENAKADEPFKLKTNEHGMPVGVILSEFQNFDLKLSSANEFGNIQTYTRSGLEHVPYTIKRCSEKTSNNTVQELLQIDFEVMGTCKNEDLQFKVDEMGGFAKIVITGTSRENVISEPAEILVQNTRKFGHFTITTDELEISGFTINKADKVRITHRAPGLITCTFVLHRALM